MFGRTRDRRAGGSAGWRVLVALIATVALAGCGATTKSDAPTTTAPPTAARTTTTPPTTAPRSTTTVKPKVKKVKPAPTTTTTVPLPIPDVDVCRLPHAERPTYNALRAAYLADVMQPVNAGLQHDLCTLALATTPGAVATAKQLVRGTTGHLYSAKVITKAERVAVVALVDAWHHDRHSPVGCDEFNSDGSTSPCRPDD